MYKNGIYKRNVEEKWHKEITGNKPTCYIDYNEEDFVVYVRYPLGAYPRNCIWYYPCVFNDKPLILKAAEMYRLGINSYGKWGIHYL